MALYPCLLRYIVPSFNHQHLGVLALLAVSLTGAHAQQPIDPAQAKKVFAEAEALSKREGGRLWHKPLYGPPLRYLARGR